MELFKSVKQRMNKADNKSTNALALAGLTAAAAIGGYFVGKWFKSSRLQQTLKAFEEQSIAENKIILHCTPVVFETYPHASPFVARVMTFLELNKIPYIVDTTMAMHFYTQKMPWITYKNHHQPDSSLIIEYIQSHPDFKCEMDRHLNVKERAVSTAFKSMIDDGLSPVIGIRRCAIDENWKKYGEMVFSTMGMSGWKTRMVVSMAKKKIKEWMWITGIGRFSKVEVFAKGDLMLQSIVDTIGDKKFFFGDTISTVDIWIYGHCSGMYQLSRMLTWGGVDDRVPSKMPYTNEMSAYLKRVEAECYGELKYWEDL